MRRSEVTFQDLGLEQWTIHMRNVNIIREKGVCIILPKVDILKNIGKVRFQRYQSYFKKKSDVLLP